MPDEFDKQSDLSRTPEQEIAVNAVMSLAHSHTFRIIDKRDRSAGGTGVAIRLGNHYFLATAGHVVSEDHEFEIAFRPDVLSYECRFLARHVSCAYDVGLLEIHPDSLTQFENRFLGSESIVPKLDTTVEWDVTVMGFPGRFMREGRPIPLSDQECLVVNRCDMLTYSSYAFVQKDYPSSLSTPAEPSVDLFVSFNPVSNRMRFMHAGGTGEAAQAIDVDVPHLGGISGGGIWIFISPERSSGIWSPGVRLVGLEHSVNEDRTWLRGKMMCVWLDLVLEHYPSLQDEVQMILGKGIAGIPR